MSRLFSKYIIPLQICREKSHSVSTFRKLIRKHESFKHSSSERKCANSVTSIRESVSSTTPYNRTMLSCSIECIIAASFRNSIGFDCIRSRHRHLMATWIYGRDGRGTKTAHRNKQSTKLAMRKTMATTTSKAFLINRRTKKRVRPVPILEP